MGHLFANRQHKSKRTTARTAVSIVSLASVVTLLFTMPPISRGDTIYLRNGWKYSDVTIIEETETKLVIQLSGGETVTLPQSAVAGSVVDTKAGGKLDRGTRSIKVKGDTDGRATQPARPFTRWGRQSVRAFRNDNGIPIFTNIAWKFDREYEEILTQLEPINLYRPGGEPTSTVLKQALSQEVAVSDERRTYSVSLRRHLDDSIRYHARLYSVRPELVKAVIRAESYFDADAVSPKGAMGLMQLMPRTADAMNITDPFDPEQNIAGGTQYLGRLLKMFGGDERLAVAAYNAGPGRVKQHGGIPPFPETRDYVARVFHHAEIYARQMGT